MADPKLESGTEKQKSKLSTFAGLLPMIVVLTLIFGLRAYNDWSFDNESVTGIGISFQEVVTKSRLVVSDVHKNTPAFQAGLQKDDIILSVNQKEIVTAADFPNAVKNLQSGSKVELTILRNGKELAIVTEVAALKRKDFK